MNQKKSKINVGFAQMNPTVGDFDQNLKKILNFAKQASDKKLDLVIFPELAISGYPVWDLANKSSFLDKNKTCLEIIIQASQGINSVIVIGFIDRGENNSSHNAIAVIHQGKLLAKQYKSLLPNYDVFLEQIFFEPANDQTVIDLFGVSVGLSVCEDLWEDEYDQKPLAKLKEMGAEVIINISASPYHKNKGEVRSELIQRKSKQYGLPIIYCNQVGAQDELIFDGNSLISSPDGTLVYEASSFQEGLFEAVLDLNEPDGKPASISKNVEGVEATYNALVLGVRDYVRKNGFKRVLVGLSGGIDSALTACIAVDALSPSQVLGVTMPGPYSSPGSVSDSKELADNLGIEFREHSIKEIYDFKIKEINQNKKNEGFPIPEKGKISLAMENLQARLRGIELMYISNDEGLLLLSTGNKSELAMGYCTIYGDMCGGLCVLGDLYKTEVFCLSRYRNQISYVIPENTLEKPPSAELRPDQKDEDSLPSYELLDQILRLYIEKNKTVAEIEKELKPEASTQLIKELIQKVDHNEYKRRQAAPILRVTEKAWFGRRMPITNRFDLGEV